GPRAPRASKEKYLVVFAAKIVQNTLNFLIPPLPPLHPLPPLLTHLTVRALLPRASSSDSEAW
ncbi:MAG: hypothetical protein ACYT04_43035, partial [Nostoc sp.]